MWKKLQAWFEKNRRPFPWRENPTPYRVWVSEIMLQQTRASVVVDYFERWMNRFPTIESLGEAREEEVIKLWEGLGYYSRARNLHRTAREIRELPSTRGALEDLPGIGPYTAGAIMSFAFGKNGVALDGNVIRVLSRLLNFQRDVGKHQKELFEWLDTHLTSPDVMEALIELGALVCGKTPKCLVCPMLEQCKARKLGVEKELPIKEKRAKITKLHRRVYCIEAHGHFLIRRVEPGRVMEGLYEFPYREIEDQEGGGIVHHFTRFKVHLHPVQVVWAEKIPVMGYEWVKLDALAQFPFSSGHRKVLHEFIHSPQRLTCNRHSLRIGDDFSSH